jgi:hypothetical protein
VIGDPETPIKVSASKYVYYPTAAFNSTAKQYTVCWQGFYNASGSLDGEILCQRLDGSGAKVGDESFVVSSIGLTGSFTYPTVVGAPALATHPSKEQYQLVWEQTDDIAEDATNGPLVNGEWEIFARRMGTADTAAETTAEEAPLDVDYSYDAGIVGDVVYDYSGLYDTSYDTSRSYSESKLTAWIELPESQRYFNSKYRALYAYLYTNKPAYFRPTLTVHSPTAKQAKRAKRARKLRKLKVTGEKKLSGTAYSQQTVVLKLGKTKFKQIVGYMRKARKPIKFRLQVKAYTADKAESSTSHVYVTVKPSKGGGKR